MKSRIFVIVLMLFAYFGNAHSAVINGSCGVRLTWSLNTQDSTMTIEGSGNMTSHPWDEYKSYIKYVSLPDGLTSIAASAFADCVNLAAITIPDGVVNIGTNAFNDCDNIKSINIPNSVTSIGSNAFSYCYGLKEVHINNLMAWCNIQFEDVYANPLTYAHHLYLFDSEITDLIIPDGFTEVKVNAFYECHGLTSVTIPDGVTKINARAFSGCTGLTSIILGKSINNLGYDAFFYCNNVKRLIVHASTPPTGGTQCGINNLSCSLYVPAESIELYGSTVWWEDFNRILSIGSNVETYRVEFRNWDGTLLQDSQIGEGSMPEYTGDTPMRPDDEQYTYTFTGWTPEIVVVTEDATYTATYDAMSIGEGIEDIYTDGVIPHKVFNDGQIYIFCGAKIYAITGQEVR